MAQIFGIKLPFGNNDDMDYDDGEFYEDSYEEGPGGTALKPRRNYREEPEVEERSGIAKFRTKKEAKKVSGSEIVLLRPQNMEDARDLTDILLAGQTVLLNLEHLDRDIAQRIIDFACGSTYAVRGTLQNISNLIYVIAPRTVGVSGDFPQSQTGNIGFKSLRG